MKVCCPNCKVTLMPDSSPYLDLLRKYGKSESRRSQVAKCIAVGMTIEDTAVELGISRHNVVETARRAMEGLSVTNAVELALLLHGFIDGAGLGLTYARRARERKGLRKNISSMGTRT